MIEISVLPKTIEKEINALIKYGYYSSIDEAIKDAFMTLLNVKPDLKISAAIELYREEVECTPSSGHIVKQHYLKLTPPQILLAVGILSPNAVVFHYRHSL